MQANRHVRLFRNGANQALRIPRDFELPGTEALLRKEGNRLIVEPIEQDALLTLLASWQDEAEGLPEVADLPAEPVDF
ncbi:MAG TPA: AbrB/MazE/SpoVT family DNA-binding domain-containing protein [Gallionella sp.]|nr:AbrB/MazE/SpoVT family DNA-binding domain-containing protein [Gallionella sp.]